MSPKTSCRDMKHRKRRKNRAGKSKLASWRCGLADWGTAPALKLGRWGSVEHQERSTGRHTYGREADTTRLNRKLRAIAKHLAALADELDVIDAGGGRKSTDTDVRDG